MTTLYGIPACDTVKKARTWLDNAAIGYSFVDLRAGELNQALLEPWLQALGHSQLINTRSTTWRSLTPQEQTLAQSAAPWAVLLAKPTLLKRPVLVHQTQVYTGFSPEQYTRIFNRT